MLQIEESIKILSGRTFRRIIRMHTNSRVRAIGSGTLITALLLSHEQATNFDRALYLKEPLNPTPQIDKSKPETG